jgi:hypothetical protein
MDALYDHFWDFVQDHLPYSVYDSLYTLSGHLTTIFNGLNTAITWAYRSAYVFFSKRGFAFLTQPTTPAAMAPRRLKASP